MVSVIHPVQESGEDLSRLEREVGMVVEGEKVAREVEVVVRSVSPTLCL